MPLSLDRDLRTRRYVWAQMHVREAEYAVIVCAQGRASADQVNLGAVEIPQLWICRVGLLFTIGIALNSRSVNVAHVGKVYCSARVMQARAVSCVPGTRGNVLAMHQHGRKACDGMTSASSTHCRQTL